MSMSVQREDADPRPSHDQDPSQDRNIVREQTTDPALASAVDQVPGCDLAQLVAVASLQGRDAHPAGSGAASRTGAGPWLEAEVGRRIVRRLLEKLAERSGGHVVTDLDLGGTTVGLTAVLPTGLFVVDVRHWGGPVSLVDDLVFIGNQLPVRTRSLVERERCALTRIVGDLAPVEAVVTVIPRRDLRFRGRTTGGTEVLLVENLAAHLTAPRAEPLSAQVLAEVVDRLRARARLTSLPGGAAHAAEPASPPTPSRSPLGTHGVVLTRAARRNERVGARTCLRCGTPMDRRVGARGEIWSCSTPRCLGGPQPGAGLGGPPEAC